MKSKQHNFNSNFSTLKKFEEFILSNGLIILNIPVKELQVTQSQTIFQNDDKLWPLKYITAPELADKIEYKFVSEQNYYTIDVIKSPVIELLIPQLINNTLPEQKCRIYFITEFFDEKGTLMKKDKLFLENAEKVLKWAKNELS